MISQEGKSRGPNIIKLRLQLWTQLSFPGGKGAGQVQVWTITMDSALTQEGNNRGQGGHIQVRTTTLDSALYPSEGGDEGDIFKFSGKEPNKCWISG